MIRDFEKNVLNKISFAERYLGARREFIKKTDSAFNPTKKETLDLLNLLGKNFTRKDNQYFTDEKAGEFTFRFLFDIKASSLLTYIYVLKDGQFIDNGLSHFGYMLNDFDLSKIQINTQFGINNQEEFLKYCSYLVTLFEDFKKEFVKSNNDGQTGN